MHIQTSLISDSLWQFNYKDYEQDNVAMSILCDNMTYNYMQSAQKGNTLLYFFDSF